MTTARDLITLAFHDAGIFSTGNAPAADDINKGLMRLNQMIYQWRRSRWLIYSLVRTSHNMNGSVSYTVGPGGDYDMVRPDRLEDGCRVLQISPGPPNQVGWPLHVVPSYENYQKIRLQQLGSFPLYIFYESSFPLGKVYPWPLPSSAYAVEILTKVNLQSFTNLSNDIELPLEYETAITYNLQHRLRMAYRLAPDAAILGMAKATLQAIKNANTQVPTLMMPPELYRDGLYNIFSDNTV